MEKAPSSLRFAAAVQKGFCEVRWEAERHTAFLWRTDLGINFSVSWVFSGTSLILSRLLLLGLSDFVNEWQQCHIMLASPPGRPIPCF